MKPYAFFELACTVALAAYVPASIVIGVGLSIYMESGYWMLTTSLMVVAFQRFLWKAGFQYRLANLQFEWAAKHPGEWARSQSLAVTTWNLYLQWVVLTAFMTIPVLIFACLVEYFDLNKGRGIRYLMMPYWIVFSMSVLGTLATHWITVSITKSINERWARNQAGSDQ